MDPRIRISALEESVAQLRRLLADSAKVIRTLETENAALRRQLAESEASPR